MRGSLPSFGLLLSGAGRRVLVALLIIAGLWGGFFWATAQSGGL